MPRRTSLLPKGKSSGSGVKRPFLSFRLAEDTKVVIRDRGVAMRLLKHSRYDGVRVAFWI